MTRKELAGRGAAGTQRHAGEERRGAAGVGCIAAAGKAGARTATACTGRSGQERRETAWHGRHRNGVHWRATAGGKRRGWAGTGRAAARRALAGVARNGEGGSGRVGTGMPGRVVDRQEWLGKQWPGQSGAAEEGKGRSGWHRSATARHGMHRLAREWQECIASAGRGEDGNGLAGMERQERSGWRRRYFLHQTTGAT